MNNNDMEELLMDDYVDYRLRKAGFVWRSRRSPAAEPTAAMRTLRRLSDDFEVRYTRTFDELNRHIVLSKDTAHDTFMSVVNELFIDGVKWGRVVGLFSFTAKLALQAMEKEDEDVVNCLVEWSTEYIRSKLSHWIYQHGGWEGFVEFYGGSAALNENEHHWPTWSKFCSYVVPTGVQALCRAIIQNT